MKNIKILAQKIAYFRDFIIKSSFFSRIEVFLLLFAEILAFIFISTIAFDLSEPKKILPFLGLALWLVLKFFKFPIAEIQLRREDWIFIGMISVTWFLCIISSLFHVSVGLSENVYVLKDLKNFVRIALGIFVFSSMTSKAFPFSVAFFSILFSVVCVNEYAETGTRIFIHLNLFAGISLFILSVYYFEKYFKKSRLLGSLFLLSSVCAALTFSADGSRAAVFAVIVGIIIYAFLACFFTNEQIQNRVRMIGIGIVLFFLVGFSLMPNLALNRFSSSSIQSFKKESIYEKSDCFSSGRVNIWQASWEGILNANPIYGIGGDSGDFSPERVPSFERVYYKCRFPHNTTLWFWLKFGLIGLCATIILQFSGIYWGIAMLKKKRVFPAIVVIPGTIICILLGFFDQFFCIGTPSYYFFVLISLVFFDSLMKRSVRYLEKKI